MAAIDLNSDLGEGYGPWRMGDDEALLDIVTSANIACGGHAGDPLTMQRTVRSAGRRGISIGAHVSYPDLRGFGRRHLEIRPDEIGAEVLAQLGALDAIARGAGVRVGYVKPHGALYNEMVVDPELAAAVVAAIASFDATLPLLTLPGSVAIEAAARQGLPVYREGFPDRAYQPDGRLVSRGQPGAVLHDPQVVAARAVRMATEGSTLALDGTPVALQVDTICVHGDSPDAVATASAVRTALTASDVTLAPFTARALPGQGR
jgi:UPF0271 protein